MNNMYVMTELVIKDPVIINRKNSSSLMIVVQRRVTVTMEQNSL